MAKELTYRMFVSINGEVVPWNSLPQDKKEEVSITLNDRAMRSIGYKPIEDKTA